MCFIQRQHFMNETLGMYPAQGMQQDIKLAHIITDYRQIMTQTMFQDATQQSPFGGNSAMTLFRYR
jgi:hypothetical protein